MIAAGAETVLLDPTVMSADVGWRVGLLIGPVIVLAIAGWRRALPESPRWLLVRGRETEAERMVARIEDEVRATGHVLRPSTSGKRSRSARAARWATARSRASS